MAIKIIRNEEANCITFRGTSVPAYFNACLSGVVSPDDPDMINVRNDIRSQDQPEDFFEFSNIHYTEFEDKDGNPFTSALEVANYVTEQGNVLGVNDSGEDLTGITVNFKLDQTSTSIVLDNGYSFGVNTIKAVAQGGTISINSIGEGVPNEADAPNAKVHLEKLDHTLVTVNGSAVSGGLNDVINTLNELFTVGAFEAVVIADPYSTMVADVSGVDTTNPTYVGNSIDPIGDDIWGTTSSNSQNGFLTTETINQAGEYFTFDIRNIGTIGFGLVHTQDSFDDGYYSGNVNYANPSNFGVLNSAHYGYQFSHWFHQTPKGSWTNYGSNTSYSMRPGWSNWDQKQDWIDGNPVKIKVGIDENGYISIESLQNDGSWVVHARTSYPIQEGAEFRLGIKANSTSVRLYTNPKVHLLEETAPTMYFRYIESPDGVYQYPLFATQEEAEYYDLNHGGTTGTGTSHTHIYADDPTSTTWYMPDTGSIMNGSTTPQDFLHTVFMGNTVTYTEITSLTDADLVPSSFVDTTITVNELSAVNYQLSPLNAGYVTTIGGIPSWTVQGGNTLVGTAPEVTGDNVTNPSDTTTVTVYRTNSYGTSQGTLTINITNLTPPTTAISGFTHVTGSTSLVDSNTLADGSAVSVDELIGDGERIHIEETFMTSNVLAAMNAGGSVYMGILNSGADLSSITEADFSIGMMFYKNATNDYRGRRILSGAFSSNSGLGSNGSTFVWEVFFANDSTNDYYEMSLTTASLNGETKPMANTGETWSMFHSTTALTPGDKEFVIAVTGSTLDISTTGVSEHNIPVPSPTILTSWDKALDFSGSNEHAKLVSSSASASALRMGGTSSIVSAPTDLTKASNDSGARPWATAIVFKIDGHNSNQHIWNSGEGVNNSDDNIYLRLDSSKNLYFGWGRSGALNECRILTSLNTSNWYGIYIGHKGTRLSGSNATASNLANAFDIYLMYSGDNFNSVGVDYSISSRWLTTGGRMDRSVTGDFTIGGRGSNRSFHGKVASMVVTTLKRNQDMPDGTEIKMMITDPVKWLQDYKVGNSYRHPTQSSYYSNFSLNNLTSAVSSSVWLMGDVSLDSYSNMMRNYVQPTDQNFTKMQLNSMVSGDIQNVTIPGLS